MMNVIYAVLVLGGLGLVFGVALALTAKAFAVPANPVRDAVREALPGANCGGCGYPGCDALADAIASGKAPLNACPVGGAEAAKKIAAAMGQEPIAETEKMVAHVICGGTLDRCKVKHHYAGIKDCVAATLAGNGDKACAYACLGYGTCVKVCPFGAIHIDERDRIAVVDYDKCQSCGKCVEACPKKVLEMLPVSLPVEIHCRAAAAGKLVSDNCRVGCVGCGLCEKSCNFGAIEMVNHLPKIDRTKCVGCMMCAENCPTSAIWADFDHRMIASIDKNLCVGCTICKKQCHFDAIAGALKEKHEILEACTGCGECIKKCPRKAITLHVREHVRDEFAKAGTDGTPIAVTMDKKETAAEAPKKAEEK
jgi:electron transport complex protein RnfB